MKIITEPTVYVVGRQTVDQAELGRFLADHDVTWQSDAPSAAETMSEAAGRLCYMSFAKPRPGGNTAYLGHIKEAGHGNVTEHAVWNFIFTGVSRSLAQELTRHRAGWSYSMLSQRYVDESVAEYIEPDAIAQDPELHELWVKAVEDNHIAYVKLVGKLTDKIKRDEQLPAECPECGMATEIGQSWDGNDWQPRQQCIKYEGSSCRWNRRPMTTTERRKSARQAARSVLPNATETKIFVTANARALRTFIEQRGSAAADPEIRKLANKVLDVMQVEAPNLFNDYTKQPLPDGTYAVDTPYRKV